MPTVPQSPVNLGTPIARGRRVLRDRLFLALCVGATSVSILTLAILLIAIAMKGWRHLDMGFLSGFPSRRPAEAGFKPALIGSVLLCAVCAAVALPIGVATAVFLEEYKPRATWQRRLHGFIQLNIGNLAGVPSIVYGIIGLTVFVRCFGLLGSPNTSTYDKVLHVHLSAGETIVGLPAENTDNAIVVLSPVMGRIEVPRERIERIDHEYARSHLFNLRSGEIIEGALAIPPDPAGLRITDSSGSVHEFTATEVESYSTRNMLHLGSEGSIFYLRLPLGGSILAGGLTLALVVLPIVVIASREAMRAVPSSLREGAFAMGATRWQVIRSMVLPAAMPGIMTGAILAISRAIGEAAPLLVVGGVLFILFTPRNLMDDFAAMPLQIFNWAGRPQEAFAEVAASGILVLLGILLILNAAAIVVRQRFSRPLS